MSTFDHIVVVGAGTMGHGIAQVSAMAGAKVTLVDQNAEAVAAGLEKVKANLEKGVARGKVDAEVMESTLARLQGGSLDAAAPTADLVIEAIVENLDVKSAFFADVAQKVPPHTVLASNTSSLSVTEMGNACGQGHRLLGIHFFNPVHIMKLVELVRGANTDEAIVQKVITWAGELKKTHITVNDAPGFATSRLGITLGNEAMRMFEQNVASASDIDTAMTLGYGHPMGPLALTDLVGLDVRLHISSGLAQTLGTEGFHPPKILKDMVAAGHLGKKAGKGFYLWEDGKIAGENPEAISLRG